MKPILHKLPYRIGDKFRFVAYGDVHIGNRLASLKHFQKEVVERYKDEPNTYFIDMGDGLDCIVAQTRDKRFKASMVDERYLGIDHPIDQMVDDYCAVLAPIKDRILVMVDSNHHMSLTDSTGTNVSRRIAYNLWGDDKRLIGYSGFLGVRFQYESGNQRCRTLTFSLCHGIGTGGKTEGGFLTTLGHDSNFYEGDIFVYGHNHRLAGHDRIIIGPNATFTKILSKKKIILNTGTYLKSFSDDASTSYSEKARFKPNELGHMELNVKLHRNGEEIYWVKRSVL